jgi:CheY-like chemotaxis protein
MTSPRPRIILVDAGSFEPSVIDALTATFDIERVETVEAARALSPNGDTAVVLPGPNAAPVAEVEESARAVPILERLGRGVGLVDGDGRLVWMNARLSEADEELRHRFVECCMQARRLLAGPRATDSSAVTERFRIKTGNRTYEVVTSAADDQAREIIGVLWDITHVARLQEKIDAIDAAGSELVRIESDTIATMNAAERLQLLEQKIVRLVRELLQFDNFEIRLVNSQTGQLELVTAIGLTPLKIGEVIYAKPKGNGISGFVAATGRSYICPNVRKDPLYREGLDNAASSLTVPLRLHDEVVGVFNIESNAANAFDDADRQFAEIFGRYIAMAMNMLDLLVRERYTTNERLAGEVLRELSEPFETITSEAEALRADVAAAPAALERVEAILKAIGAMQRRTEACAAGPRSLLGVEEALQHGGPDPLFESKRVLIADDEPTIRQTIESVLIDKGCSITVCTNGAEAIDAVRAAADRGFDLVISDVSMPEGNGYEVFRATKDASPTTPVILMTGFGYDPNHSISRASQEGLHCFLFKPFQVTQLLEEAGKALSAG